MTLRRWIAAAAGLGAMAAGVALILLLQYDTLFLAVTLAGFVVVALAARAHGRAGGEALPEVGEAPSGPAAASPEAAGPPEPVARGRHPVPSASESVRAEAAAESASGPAAAALADALASEARSSAAAADEVRAERARVAPVRGLEAPEPLRPPGPMGAGERLRRAARTPAGVAAAAGAVGLIAWVRRRGR